MISQRFIKSSIVYTVAGALPMASMIILLPFYLNYLPIEVYGALAIYTTFYTLLQVLVTYSFDTSLYIYYHDFKRDFPKLSRFISSVFLFMIVLGAVVSVVGLITGNFLFEKIYAGKPVSFYPYGLLSVVTAVFQAFFKVYSSLLQSREKPMVYFWSNILSFSLIAGLSVAGLIIFPGTLAGPVGGRMIAAVISGVWALFSIFREFGIHFDWPLLSASFAFNNSSFIYQVQQWVINSFDKILIGLYSFTDVGVYDFAFKCMLVISFITDGLNNSFQPKVVGIITDQQVKESTITTNRYYYALVAVTMLLVCGALLGYPLVFDSGLLPEKYSGYRDSLKYLPLLGMVYFIRGIRYYFVLPFGVLKYVKPLPVVYLIISVFKVGLMVLCIPRFGIYAVIGSALASSIIEIAILRMLLRGKFRFQFNVFKLILAPGALCVAIIIMEFFAPFQEHVRHGLYLAGCILLLIWVYRNELRLIRPLKTI